MKTKKKAKFVDLRTEVVEGIEYIIVSKDETIHQIDMRAISAWGLLLGLTEPAEIVAAILRHKEKRVGAGEPNLWTPLYEALGDGLDQMSQAGVPPEYMEEVLTSDAPLPTAEAVEKLSAAQITANAEIATSPDEWGDVSIELNATLDAHRDKITEGRVAFIDALAPVYEIPAPAPPQSVPEAMDLLNKVTVVVNTTDFQNKQTG